jgi:hypothetical protein
MSLSRFCHVEIRSRAISKYGVEGCGCATGGSVGFLGVTLGGAEGVEQPITNAASTSKIRAQASFTGGSKLRSFVSTTLAPLLQRLRFEVRRSRSGLPFQSDICFPCSVREKVGERENRHQRSGDPELWVQECEHGAVLSSGDIAKANEPRRTVGTWLTRRTAPRYAPARK